MSYSCTVARNAFPANGGRYPLKSDQESGAVVQANTRSPFVGRERELAELLGALEETRAGHGRAVLLGGEPGIGKSRLADELASRAEAWVIACCGAAAGRMLELRRTGRGSRRYGPCFGRRRPTSSPASLATARQTLPRCSPS